MGTFDSWLCSCSLVWITGREEKLSSLQVDDALLLRTLHLLKGPVGRHLWNLFWSRKYYMAFWPPLWNATNLIRELFSERWQPRWAGGQRRCPSLTGRHRGEPTKNLGEEGFNTKKFTYNAHPVQSIAVIVSLSHPRHLLISDIATKWLSNFRYIGIMRGFPYLTFGFLCQVFANIF